MNKFSALAAIAFTLAAGSSFAQDTKAAIGALNERLAKIGAPKVEGTDKAGEKTVPAIFYGSRKINGNYDVVDEIKKNFGATATVFVKDGDEFVRVSTNVLTPEGKRGVGTPLARNKAYEAITKGGEYCGPIEILGQQYDTCYHPIKESGGKIIGITYVGFKK